MIEISDIFGIKALEAYLREQTAEISRVIAARAALRVWPVLVGNKYWENHPTRLVFNAQRAFLISAISNIGTTPKFESAAEFSASAAQIAASAAAEGDAVVEEAAAASEAASFSAFIVASNTFFEIQASNAALATVYATGSAAEEFMDEAKIDLVALRDGVASVDVMQRPLWEGEVPNQLEEEWIELKATLSAREEGWEVWFPIYEGFRDGKWPPRAVLEQIALIPDEEWTQNDPAHTNGIIAGIFEEFYGARSEGVSKDRLSEDRRRQLEEQARFVLRSTAQAEMTAGSVAAQLEYAISAYLKAEASNVLPDDLQVFADMAVTLRGLKQETRKGVDEAEALKGIEHRILELEAENEELRKLLNVAESRSSIQTFYNAAVESGGKAFGPAALFGSFFFLTNYVDPGMYNALAVEFQRFKEDWFL